MYLLFFFMLLKVNAIIKLRNEHPFQQILTKKDMSSIIYETPDINGNEPIISNYQAVQNYDISLMPSLTYNYIISKETAFHVMWKSNETCEPIYDNEKKIAITSINDILEHNCYQSKEDNFLNVKELYEQDNLPDLLLVQFNDVYELR
eukprot:jgi/Orpsp1_1/1181063/evm.model.c7180000075689.1